MLAQHPRWTFHFTSTSASWLNAVEGFFAKLTRRHLKRWRLPIHGRSSDGDQSLHRRTNSDSQPFMWTISN